MKPPLPKSLLRSFEKAASPLKDSPSYKKKTKKRRPPLSIRLTDAQWEKLEHNAGNKPLSTFAKERIFPASASKTGTVQDAASIARILATLGQLELFRNLGTLAQLIEAGDLQLSPEQEEQISAACAAVLMMRNDLIQALGLKEE